MRDRCRIQNSSTSTWWLFSPFWVNINLLGRMKYIVRHFSSCVRTLCVDRKPWIKTLAPISAQLANCRMLSLSCTKMEWNFFLLVCVFLFSMLRRNNMIIWHCNVSDYSGSTRTDRRTKWRRARRWIFRCCLAVAQHDQTTALHSNLKQKHFGESFNLFD